MEKPNLKIVALGDSTTAGTPLFLSPIEAPPNGQGNEESQYAYWMRKLHPEWLILNRGVNGERSDQIRTRFTTDVLGNSPDYVIILAGVNDLYQGYSSMQVEKNLIAMYNLSLKSRITPVSATILPYNTISQPAYESLSSLNEWIRSTAESMKIPFCDTYSVVVEPNVPRRLRGSPDGLHPDVAGYRSMGEALAHTIEAHLKSQHQYLRNTGDRRV